MSWMHKYRRKKKKKKELEVIDVKAHRREQKRVVMAFINYLTPLVILRNSASNIRTTNPIKVASIEMLIMYNVGLKPTLKKTNIENL